MAKPKRDPLREDRIHNEAIVDAGPEEQAMGWYYYLEGRIRFPFRARCIAAKVVSPLRKGEAAEVLRMAPEDSCEHDMLVLIRRHRIAPVSELLAVSTRQAPDIEQSRLKEYGVGAQILLDIGVENMILLSNTPGRRVVALEGYGLNIVGTRPVNTGTTR